MTDDDNTTEAPDLRATYVTTNPINVGQLSDELGAPVSVNNEGGTSTIVCEDDTVPYETLKAVVDAHIPIADEPGPAPPANLTHVEGLQAQIDELTDLVLEGFF